MKSITNQINPCTWLSCIVQKFVESQFYMVNINQQPLKYPCSISSCNTFIISNYSSHFSFLPISPRLASCTTNCIAVFLNIRQLPYFAQFRDGTGNLAMVTHPSTFGTALNWRILNFGSVSSPLCVWELERVNYVNWDVLVTILDNYMFRPLLAIFRLSSRELKIVLYNVHTRDGEISTSGLHNG
jgi:hypothetical protein